MDQVFSVNQKAVNQITLNKEIREKKNDETKLVAKTEGKITMKTKFVGYSVMNINEDLFTECFIGRRNLCRK